MWQGFYQDGNTYKQNTDLSAEVRSVYEYFNSPEWLENPVAWNGTTNSTTPLAAKQEPFVHFFDTTGILQHNDIAPQWHPTDVGQVKVASHLMQYIKIKFGWELMATGPEYVFFVFFPFPSGEVLTCRFRVFADTLYWNDQSDY